MSTRFGPTGQTGTVGAHPAQVMELFSHPGHPALGRLYRLLPGPLQDPVLPRSAPNTTGLGRVLKAADLGKSWYILVVHLSLSWSR